MEQLETIEIHVQGNWNGEEYHHEDKIIMKRCALVIADDPAFRDWIGWHITRQWPKMMLEHTRVVNAPMYLDRAQLSRYQLIVVRQGFSSFSEMTTGIFLLRILNLEVHPEILLIFENNEQLRAARSTKLASASSLLASELSSSRVSTVMQDIASREKVVGQSVVEGAPTIPGYRIIEPLAGTYTATVYRAFSEERGEDVAIKIRELESSKYGEGQQLTLRQEFETLRKLGDQYVAPAYEYGETGGIAYLTMEYCRRGSIGELFAKAGRSVSRVDYLRRVAEALRHVHEVGFLHLDLKPNNVLIRQDGVPLLIDFGISKRIIVARYQEGRNFSVGSPHFMSPEQIRGDTLDERSDIYSFGALWYRIFTGRVPFQGGSFDAIKFARERTDTPSMGYALRQYQPIVDRTLANDREQRFSSVEELIDGIDYFAGQATGMYPKLTMPAAAEGLTA